MNTHTTCRPRFSTLLELQKHVFAVIIVVEEVDVVDDENERLPRLLGLPESDFLELVQSFKMHQP